MDTNTDTENSTQKTSGDTRPYAVVLYGATSFVGQITAHYLTNFFYQIIRTKMAQMYHGRSQVVMKTSSTSCRPNLRAR